MPQKRNPVALEHARAIGSKAVGQAQAIVTAVHNTPFGDIVDTEDDLQPLVASMFRDATRTVTLVAAAMRLADFDVEQAGGARRRRRHHADRAGRHAGARSRAAVPIRARDRGVAVEGAHGRSARRRCRRRCRRHRRRFSASRSSIQRGRSRDDHEPAALRAGADARTAVRRRRRRRARIGESQRKLQTDREAWQLRRERLASAESAARRARQGALMKSTYVRVVIVWVVTLAALYAFQWFYTQLTHVTAIDWALIGLYLVWIVWDGIRLSKNTEKLEGYFLASKSLPWWAVGLSVMATQLSAITMVEQHRPGLCRRHGPAAAVLRAADRDDHHLGHVRPVLPPRQRLHRLRISSSAASTRRRARSRRCCS